MFNILGTQSYLFFNLFILGSLFISKIFYNKMIFPSAIQLRKLAVVTFIFTAWDIVVTNHWWFFNSTYILGWHLLSIPFEEFLFFITVPVALATFLENLRTLPIPPNIFRGKNTWVTNYFHPLVKLLLIVIEFYSWLQGWWYTVSVAFLLVLVFKKTFFTNAHHFLGLLFTLITTLVFNFYLTALPIVTYNSLYKSNVQIGPIPIEDFGFGVILYCAIVIAMYDKKIKSVH